MQSDSTSPSLLRHVRDPGDRAAWREFDARYGELILRYCRRGGLQFSDAEDVRQMVMLRLSRALREFEYDPARGRFRTYLGRVVRNEISRFFGRPSAAAPGVNMEDGRGRDGADDAAPDEPWEQEWAAHHLRRAMRQVRETFDSRSVAVFERLLGGDSVEQAAAAFGMSTQAVHKVKQRIRARLQELVARQIDEENHGHA